MRYQENFHLSAFDSQHSDIPECIDFDPGSVDIYLQTVVRHPPWNSAGGMLYCHIRGIFVELSSDHLNSSYINFDSSSLIFNYELSSHIDSETDYLQIWIYRNNKDSFWRRTRFAE